MQWIRKNDSICQVRYYYQQSPFKKNTALFQQLFLETDFI